MGGQFEDKVEVAPPKKSKEGDAGEVTVKGIRFHESKGHVHFHDDKAGLKCYVPKAVWWGEWQKLRSPSSNVTANFEHQDFDNESSLYVESIMEGDSVRVTMVVSPYVPPKTYDRVWHALEQFTNRSASGG